MKKPLRIFDTPRNIQILLMCFYLGLVVLLIVDFFIPKHAAFPWQDQPCFFAAYGFISCVLLIYIAKLIRLFLKRPEDYYDSQ